MIQTVKYMAVCANLRFELQINTNAIVRLQFTASVMIDAKEPHPSSSQRTE